MLGLAILFFGLGVAWNGPVAEASPPLGNLCGDGICLPLLEDAGSCPADCAACGDGRCDPPEDPVTCARDCGCEAPGACGGHAAAGCFCDASCVEFGDCCPDACERCGACPGGACGDGACDPGENAFDCPLDCNQ